MTSNPITQCFAMLALVAILLTACEGGSSGGSLAAGSSGGSSSSASSASASAGASSSSSSAAPGSAAGNAMVLNIYITPEVGTGPVTKVLAKTCTIPSTVDPYTGDDSATPLTLEGPNNRFRSCHVQVGENVLHKSTVTIEYGTGNINNCPYSYFAPYYYRASNAPTFQPEWNGGTSIDCQGTTSDDKDLADCYNGPAKLLIGGFPLNRFPGADGTVGPTGLYSFDIPSALSQGISSNRWIANIPENSPHHIDTNNDGQVDWVSVPRTDFAGQDGYETTVSSGLEHVGLTRTYQDYRVGCEDDFAEPLYSITLFISDWDVVTNQADPFTGVNNPNNSDPSVPGNNDYPDWDSTLNYIDPQE